MKTKRVKAQLILGALADRDLERQYILPADAKSYERMVEQVGDVLWRDGWADSSEEYNALARTALRAIGITAPKKGTQ